MKRTAAPLLCALAAGGCLSAQWRRTTAEVAPPRAALDALEPGSSDLGDALRLLGAPLEVVETEGGRGAALTWGWFDSRDLGASLSVPLTRSASASFAYDDVEAGARGAALFFDAEWRLVARREGYLRDLLAGTARARPALPADSPPAANPAEQP